MLPGRRDVKGCPGPGCRRTGAVQGVQSLHHLHCPGPPGCYAGGGDFADSRSTSPNSSIATEVEAPAFCVSALASRQHRPRSLTVKSPLIPEASYSSCAARVVELAACTEATRAPA